MKKIYLLLRKVVIKLFTMFYTMTSESRDPPWSPPPLQNPYRGGLSRPNSAKDGAWWGDRTWEDAELLGIGSEGKS